MSIPGDPMNDSVQPVRYLLIACGVLRREVAEVQRNLPSQVHLDEVWLEQGLHRDPKRLNRLVREALTAAETEERPYDAVLLGYGACSGGTLGIESGRYRIVLPRAHDCITLFLGSKERYLEEFSAAPGTYWYTPGFIDGAVQPGMSEKYAGIFHQYEDAFETYRDRFGDDLARYVVEHNEQAWIRNYSRGAYVDSGLPGGDAVREKAKAFCAARNWLFAKVKGDLGLIRDLCAGNWGAERFLVLDPGESAAFGGIDDIVTVHAAEREETGVYGTFAWRYRFDGSGYRPADDGDPPPARTTDVVIGIDAGGTFTDAAVVSLADRTVLATAKAPTTPHDLAEGIRAVLERLPADHRRAAGRVAVSTTLATNSIVEDRGARTGLLLIGYPPETAALVRLGASDLKETVPGRHDIHGTEIEALDEAALLAAAGRLTARGVEAFAVSSYLAVRNPTHERRACAILMERWLGIPAVAGRDLTDDLDAVRRAGTVLLNARLLPVIRSLADSVEAVVRDLGIAADIRLVTTEGTLMNLDEARRSPVRMVLSGPAASVEGARFLADVEDCVVADIGGTTTDIAVIARGAARRSGRGSTVGGYRTSLRAVDLCTIGLGGDSRIGLRLGRIRVGPRRAVPLSVLARAHPGIATHLQTLAGLQGGDSGLVDPGIHYLLIYRSGNSLTSRERAIVAALSEGPLSAVQLADRLAYPYLSLIGAERLEELGIVRTAGLTPTDLLVAEGRFDGGDPGTARLLIALHAARAGISEDAFREAVWDELHRKLAETLIGETLAEPGSDGSFPGCRFCARSIEGTPAIRVDYRLTAPLVAVGAPAPALMADLGRYLAAEMVFPQYHEVANAVGAAAGVGKTRIDMRIILDEHGRFVLYAPDGIALFRDLGAARGEARDHALRLAEAYARDMGYDAFTVDIVCRDSTAPSGYGGTVYLETAVGVEIAW